MTRDRLQDTTVLYRDTVDYKDVVRGFAERRGYPTTGAIVDFMKSNFAYLRERFEKLAAAFDRLRNPVPERDLSQVKEGQAPAKKESKAERPIAPPEISPQLHQSISRLSQNLAPEMIQGRKARRFERSAHYELNLAGSAQELRSFNEVLSTQIGQDAILNHGSYQPSEAAAVLRGQPAIWTDYARENWDAIFAAQWAASRAKLQPLVSQTHSPLSNKPTQLKVPMPDDESKTIPAPLIDAVPDIPPLPAAELRAQAVKDEGLTYSVAVAGDVAGRIYRDKDGAIAGLLSRYQNEGDAPKLISELERDPSAFGELKGATRLGLANAKRRNALEQVPQLTQKVAGVMDQVAQAETRISDQHRAMAAARAQPLPDLSEGAQHFLTQLAHVHQLSSGENKNQQMTDLMNNTGARQEITEMRRSLTERYGKGQSAIQKGLSEEPALKVKNEPDRQASLARINTVLKGFPIMVEMQGQMQQKDRNHDLGKEQSRGIER